MPAPRATVVVPAAALVLAGFGSVGLQAYWASTAPVRGEWSAAAAHVRERMKPGDVVGVAPWWADEARLALGDGPVVAMPDLAGEVAMGGLWRWKRLWLVAAPALGGGAASVGDRLAHLRPERPGDRARFGGVEVRGYDLEDRAVGFDAVASVASAAVIVERDGKPWTTCTSPLPGGLGFRCAPPAGTKPAHWMRVARRVREMDDTPRECLEVHPWAGASVVLRWPAVTLGRTLVVEAGLALAALRELKTPDPAPVVLRVLAGGRELALLEYPAEPGWVRRRLDTTAAGGPGTTADLVLRVAATQIEWRFFCLAVHTEGKP